MDFTLRKADEDLSLYGAGINDSQASMIANRLISNKTIKTIDLSGITHKKNVPSNKMGISFKEMKSLTLAQMRSSAHLCPAPLLRKSILAVNKR